MRRLNETVRIEQPARVGNGSGGWDKSWTEVATVAADVEAVSGRAQLHAEQPELRQTHRVTIRYRAGITAANRLVWRGRPLRIEAAPDPGPRAKFRTITAEEGAET